MVFSKLFNWYFKKGALPYWGILFLDSFMVMIAGYCAGYRQFGAMGLLNSFWPVTIGLILTWLCYVAGFRMFHTYQGVIRFSTFHDLRDVALANVCASAFAIVMSVIVERTGIPFVIMLGPGSYCVQLLVVTVLMWIVRIFVKGMYDGMRSNNLATRVFIYGNGAGAVSIAKSMAQDGQYRYKVCGFICTDKLLESKYLLGMRVYPDTPDIIATMKAEHVKTIIVSPLQTDRFREQEFMVNELTRNGFKILFMPMPVEWKEGDALNVDQLHEVDIEELLPRDPIEVDLDAIGDRIKGKCILITGAAGSIGSEMVRQVAALGAGELILIDQAETPMHDIRLLMRNSFPAINAHTIVASITDREYMENLFSTYRPQYVFHAAAYKHVPMMEDNPAEAVRNNIRGTRIIANLAVVYGVEKFVMISTDKAVNPTNVMGCSKRICEIYCQSLNKAIQDGTLKPDFDGQAQDTDIERPDWNPKTQFVTTRFGNVLGSNGSVIPLFREQIRKGGPVTVTHPDIIRFFMLIPEACKLVLEAATMGKGGEIFVFDMGRPVRIADLARRMIYMSGARNVEIKYTGLRDGEKLFEEVLSDMEKSRPTQHGKIFVAQVREYDYLEACRYEDQLMKLSYSFDNKAIVRLMEEIVPEYRSTNETYSSL